LNFKLRLKKVHHYNNSTGHISIGVFYFNLMVLKSCQKISKKLAKLVKFTLEKQKRSKILPNEDLSGILQIAKNCLLPDSNLYYRNFFTNIFHHERHMTAQAERNQSLLFCRNIHKKDEEESCQRRLDRSCSTPI
jgi:hypothetical protein